VDEEEVKNLRATIQGELPQRHFGDAVRLEVADTCPEAISSFLLAQFELQESDLYRVHGPVNLVRLFQMPDQVDRPDLRFPPFIPGLPKQLEKRRPDVFSSIRKGDILLHHPYQSFQPVVDFLEQATTDPAVVAIKMTVYRTGTDSVLMDALIRAARNGKEVTVVVELLARFDEEANIGWAAKLEDAGAHVVFGVVGYKTHCKMLMVVRREVVQEEDQHESQGQTILRRYIHLGTGNYHPRTARMYTDFGLLTCHPDMGADVSEVFQQLTGLGKPQPLKYLMQSPFTLHPGVMEAIRAETEIARSGKPARIVAKMNALLEPEVIEALYEASQAGVRIYLIIRGVCALRPGVPGLSENIKVRSVIGRFLEHHRIFLFRAGGEMKVWLSSADWMERNFFRRIETAFPILDPRIKRRVLTEGLRPYVADNTQSWMMDGQGHYTLTNLTRRGRSKQRSAQQELMGRLGKPGQE
ncbi:MAG: polyphosphate kinase, partial [Pseudomonadota bacterium]|jgi:polyphosphate kinase